MEIIANGNKCYIDENRIVGASYNSYSGDTHEVQLSNGVGFYQIQVANKEEAEKVIKEIINCIKNPKEDDYITGFKEGVEYALKLKDNTCTK